MSRSYAELLNDYLFCRPKRSRYWQRYKDRWWRLCGTYSYKGRREEVLEAYRKRRKKYGERDAVRLLLQPSPLLELLAKDTVWQGTTLVVPFQVGGSTQGEST